MTDDIVLGEDLDTGRDVRERRAAMKKAHAILLGFTRTGKTSLTIGPVVGQLMQPNSTGQHDDIVVIDNGGDSALFWWIKAQAESHGREFQPIFVHPDLDGYNFDPFQSSTESIGGVLDRAGLLMESSAISKARAYGVQWFWLNNMVSAILAVKRAMRDGVPLTLTCIRDYLRRHIGDFSDAQQILLAIELLLAYPQLSSTDGESGKFVRWGDVEAKNAVVYVYAPTLNQPAAPYLATLVAHSLVAHKLEQTLLGTNRRHVFIVWDEWQCAASEQFGELLSQSAKHKITFILANQSIKQLDAVNESLADIVLTNTAIQMFYSPYFEEEKLYLQQHSELIPTILGGKTVNRGGAGVTEREVLDHKLSHNQILRVASTFGAAILLRRNQSGFEEPVKIWNDHAVTPDVYEELSNRPLPLRPKPKPAPIPLRAPGWAGAVRDDAHRAREEAFRALYESKLAWLAGE
jgi:hypothetical protein